MLQLSRVIASCDMGGGGCDAGMPSFQVWVDAIGEKDGDTIMQRLDANLYQFIMNLLDKFYSNRRSLCKIFFKITPNTREFPHKREPFVHVGEVHLLHIMLHNAMAFRSMLYTGCANVPCHKPKSRRCFSGFKTGNPCLE